MYFLNIGLIFNRKAYRTSTVCGTQMIWSMTMTDEDLLKLSACADGELTEPERKEIEAKLEREPALAEALTLFKKLDAAARTESIPTFPLHATEALWPLIAERGFAGRYGADRWMLVGWSVAVAIQLCQVVLSSGIQAFRAFKPLALANAAASVVAIFAVLAGTHWLGPGGAIAGTAAGGAAELAVMAVVLMSLLRPRRPAVA